VGDLQTHYRIVGDGPPLVLIMGLSGDLTWWEPLVEELERDFRLILFDNRGSGLTDMPEGKYSIPMFANDTAGLMASLGIDRAHVFGVSMGGMIAQELVLRYPDRVDRLVLGCTHSGGEGFTMPSAEAVEKMALTRGRAPEEIARQTMSILFSPKFIQENPDTIEEMVLRFMDNPTPRKPFIQQLWAAMGHNCYERLPKIRKPTLLLTGGEDVLIPPQNAETLRARIPGSRLACVEDAGHVFFLEAPKRVARLLREHLLQD
jgi:pimeloyl-ACP methyl ester carboxylesterase